MNYNRTTRRGFLKQTSLGAAAAVVFPYIVPSSARGAEGATAPSSRIVLGLIGTGNISGGHREAFLAHKDCQIVAVCDPVKNRREPFRDRINSVYGSAVCTDYRDFRDLLARPDIDAVCIGVPDHWHAIHALRAMQAGKDVYVEKPLTRTVVEGRRLVRAAANYGRILQTGIQRRSGSAFRRVCELVRNGRIGRLTNVEVGIIGINTGVQARSNFPATAVPEDFDYDMWLGPAPVAPFSPQRVARGNEVCYWYYISDYTAGFISGNGVHFVDIGQWGIGDDVKPVEVHALSADCPADGLIDCPIAWQSEIVYANGVKMSYSSEGNPHPDGIRFVGTEGWIHISGNGTTKADPAGVLTSVIGPDELHLYGSPGHHRNFLDCIKSRQVTAASADIGHNATTTCNLVEISARLGRPLKWDSQAESFVNDTAADRLLSRATRMPWRL
ncbi:MAG: Gfo/Idh/MocA family oxidoreductase [Phycisphaerae bacterium]|nr:Gfo/Idh/MocA family oxidoreductase [Phycisphaerae bacterium]